MMDPLRKALNEMQREIARGWQTKWHASSIPSASLVDEATIRSVRESIQQKMADAMWKQFTAAYSPIGMAPVYVQWSESEDGDSWSTHGWTCPEVSEWEYVEEFCGKKVYRRVWQDGREEWTSNVPGSMAWVFRAPESRLELRRAILRNRDMPVRRAADGGLLGWRYWTLPEWRRVVMTSAAMEWFRPEDITPILRSPHRGTIWDGPTLSAIEWSDEAACEGVAGIHASLQTITAYQSRGATVLASNGANVVTGRVRGYGRCVLGTRGWRAERVVIDYLRVPADIYDEVKGPLSERYQCDIRRQWR